MNTNSGKFGTNQKEGLWKLLYLKVSYMYLDYLYECMRDSDSYSNILQLSLYSQCIETMPMDTVPLMSLIQHFQGYKCTYISHYSAKQKMWCVMVCTMSTAFTKTPDQGYIVHCECHIHYLRRKGDWYKCTYTSRYSAKQKILCLMVCTMSTAFTKTPDQVYIVHC